MNTTNAIRPVSIRRAGTVNCEVKLMINKAEIARLRQVFKIPADAAIKFSACELLDQGRGWWLCVGDDWHDDAALVIFKHLDFALNHQVDVLDHKVRVVQSVTLKHVVPAVYKNGRVVIVCKPTDSKRGSVARNHRLSAALVLANTPAWVHKRDLDQHRAKLEAQRMAALRAELAVEDMRKRVGQDMGAVGRALSQAMQGASK